MLKGFKEFILRGNVIDLAVAVVIGAAFGAIVTAATEKLVQPLIASLGSSDLGGLGFSVRTDTPEMAAATFLDFGAVITAAINFIIVAAIIYFALVLPMNKLAERRAAGVEPEAEAPSEEVILLREIRDALNANPKSLG